ncbi:MAG: molybdopterin-binding protein [Bacteroidia bacterium]
MSLKNLSLIFTIVIFKLADCCSQRIVTPSNEFKIEGKIKTELVYTLNDLDTFTTQNIRDLEINNQKGELKETIKGLKGIPLKKILEQAVFTIDKPKELNEFYFTFIATDGYKAVFSWNEIFNTETGNNIFIVTEKDRKKLRDMEERILIISSSDFKIGRRYIKGLSKIVINRAE